MRIIVLVQARTGSSRLPRKVLLPLGGGTVLSRQIERIRAARTPFALAVATTTDPADDAIVAHCDALHVAVYRGHPTDLLDRHVRAARVFDADVVVKIPSDCPLIDPAVIDAVIGAYLAAPGRYDYVSNLHPATWPDGQDVEVVTLAALTAAWREAKRPLEREHTTPFLWERDDRFRCHNVAWPGGRDLSMSHRWTLDWPEDLAFIREVYDALWTPSRPVFGVEEVLALLAARPELARINAAHAGVNWYRHHLDELRTIAPSQTRAEEAR